MDDTLTRTTPTSLTAPPDQDDDRVLRYAAVVFLVALLLHGADHLRRGFDVVSRHGVRWPATSSSSSAVVAVVLVFRRHRLAPLAAIAIGFPSAIGFAAAHLLPHWSSFSDSFTGSDVGARRQLRLSWVGGACSRSPPISPSASPVSSCCAGVGSTPSLGARRTPRRRSASAWHDGGTVEDARRRATSRRLRRPS